MSKWMQERFGPFREGPRPRGGTLVVALLVLAVSVGAAGWAANRRAV